MKRPRIPKINSMHFGGAWLGVSLLVGGVLPLLGWLMLHVMLWPLCAIGGVMLLAFAVVFAVEMHQDFARIPYYEQHLAEDIPFDPQRQDAVLRVSSWTGESIAGFRDRVSGAFTEVMVIRSPEDARRFMRLYRLESLCREYD
ncbi:MAG: hypothetical protein ACI4MJ_00390 [Aristaeellaceae bacterium]